MKTGSKLLACALAMAATQAGTGVAAQTAPDAAAPAAPAAAGTPAGAVPATKSGAIPAPPAGKGLVVFYRPGSMFGAALGCTVHEGGQELARLGSGKYYTVVAEPGTHQYFTEGEATDKINVEVEADETYFVRCNIGMGVMSGRANLSPADAATFATKAKGLTMWKGPAKQ